MLNVVPKEMISFEQGGKDLLNGKQTEIRRKWPDRIAQRFKIGDAVEAWGVFSPAIGMKQIALIEITSINHEGKHWVFGFKVLEQYKTKESDMTRQKLLKKKLKPNHVYTLQVRVPIRGEKDDVRKVKGCIFKEIVNQKETRPGGGKWKAKTRTYVSYVACGDDWVPAGGLCNSGIEYIDKVWHKGHCKDFVDAATADEWREKNLYIKTAESGLVFVGTEDWENDTTILQC